MGASYRDELTRQAKAHPKKAGTALPSGSKKAAIARSKAIAWQQSRKALYLKAEQQRLGI